MVRAFAAAEAGGRFERFDYELPPLAGDNVDIDVEYCGVCHSDFSMWANEWRRTHYPFVGGHEVVGRVRAVGPDVKGLAVGQKVGLGWFSRSDLTTNESLCGDHNLSPGNEGTIIGRHGGFADIVRCQAIWALPLPDDVTLEAAGPLFCGGITVFNPLIQFDVKPVDRVGVIGIGGLGHLALQFLNKWGCEVTAFTSTADKAAEAKSFGATRTLDSRNPDSWKEAYGRFDMLMSTVAVDLDWDRLIRTLRPRGRLHLVGVSPSPVALRSAQLMGNQLSYSSSPLGAPATTAKMLEFCARHGIAPQIEVFQMSKINEAMAHLHDGKARYRVVLKNDF
ncbi:MAG: alcohol dehydrogenase catalytic domain-containing protein [Alphaproteobacteria bacterium]|nr:alcohol dehydrogenase catalytic domain-containing protein [Alphaproteobacteria bacterium]